MARVFCDFSICDSAGAYSRGRRPRSTTPYAVSRSDFSRASSSLVIRSASSLVTSLRLEAAFMQAPSEVSEAGMASTSARTGLPVTTAFGRSVPSKGTAQAKMAALEGSEDAVLFSSGISAIGVSLGTRSTLVTICCC